MKNYTIRKLQKEDISIVQSIAKNVIREKYILFFSQSAIDMFINSGKADNEFVKNFDNCNVLTNNGKIVGFNIFFDNFIHLMMIDLNQQSKGYGKILLDYAEKIITKQGYKLIQLETFKENVQAMNFYQKNGWLVKDEKQEKDLNVTRVFLEKKVAENGNNN